jgi:hypothetical protein
VTHSAAGLLVGSWDPGPRRSTAPPTNAGFGARAFSAPTPRSTGVDATPSCTRSSVQASVCDLGSRHTQAEPSPRVRVAPRTANTGRENGRSCGGSGRRSRRGLLTSAVAPALHVARPVPSLRANGSVIIVVIRSAGSGSTVDLVRQSSFGVVATFEIPVLVDDEGCPAQVARSVL